MKKRTGAPGKRKYARCHNRPCLMAYTLNDTQPVICTLVADQPYFYMDEEIAPEDDILGLEMIENFEKEIADIKKKIDAYDKVAKQYEVAPDARLLEFRTQAFAVSDIVKTSSDDAVHAVDQVLDNLTHSRMGKTLLEFAQDHHVFVIESLHEETARYDGEKSIIYINPHLGISELTLLAVRELRRHWHHRKGVMIHPLTFHPDHAVLINRAQHADLSMAMVRTAWEMQLAGRKDAWAYVESSHLSDLGRAYAREANTDFRAINSGKASYAVFESWFMSERCRHQDKKLIQQMLADHNGYVFDQLETSKNISIELISALGEQPFGKNYLASYARTIVEDPVFAEVRDRSNANFLWFVKFERSFRETEQGLQIGSELFGASALTSDPFFAGDPDHDKPSHDKPSTVVQLNARPQDAQDNNIIHVQFGKGKGA